MLQEKHNTKHVKISNTIQTNGMLITDEWAEFFHQNHFLVGISLDGPGEIHNLNRVDKGGKGSFNRVMKAIRMLEKHKVDFNILCVVSKPVAKHPEKVYRFFRKQGFEYLQFIPCLDSFDQQPGQADYSLTPELYGAFLKGLFDLWYADLMAGKHVSIRMFDNITEMLLGYPPESCDMRGQCSANLVVEADGSIYPCDFYVTDQWKLGKIGENAVTEMLTGETVQKFVRTSLVRPEACLKCSYYPLCRGGCRRHYKPLQNGVSGENYFCPAYREFYQYALPRFQRLMTSSFHPV